MCDCFRQPPEVAPSLKVVTPSSVSLFSIWPASHPTLSHWLGCPFPRGIWRRPSTGRGNPSRPGTVATKMQPCGSNREDAMAQCHTHDTLGRRVQRMTKSARTRVVKPWLYLKGPRTRMHARATSASLSMISSPLQHQPQATSATRCAGHIDICQPARTHEMDKDWCRTPRIEHVVLRSGSPPR